MQQTITPPRPRVRPTRPGANDPYQGVALGARALDTITRFEGIVTGQCRYITGCAQVLLTPETRGDNDFREARWFDVERVAVIAQDCVEIEGAAKGADLVPPAREGHRHA